MDALAHKDVAQLEVERISLALFADVLDGVKQGRINANQFGEHPRIDLITLALVLVNGAQFAGIGDDDLTACLLQQATNPGAMGAYFKCQEGLGVVLRELQQVLAVIGEAKFLENISLLVSDADRVFGIPEVDADYEL